ncbi:phosphoribosylanthranilate isomerase [Rhodovarius crocodyli]|uniref:N-(5'-phosphoribosyl)anthranilate isomerase n=1 Tax=Rhodovarius crocodyli TaxID=1979269 RepID=A0A437MLR8_9PROT|nr:phosphoribosylanthranilate isomerase [Rhodovarius crocodyli]RVT98546.1 phosphoribosylanthranilate isomerase [Rhodovarius crocodyli]
MEIKICGLSTVESLALCAELAVDHVGFVFFPPSPRAVTPEQAGALCAAAPAGPRRVGLFVDADDALLDATLAAAPLDMLQLHGTESPERCAAIRARFGLPVMKAIGIGTAEDFAQLDAYAPVVDRFLLDAKPAPGAALPGGNAHPFEWALLAGRAIPRPWLLAGGLTPANVSKAIQVSGAPGVDVSSGVEESRGVKSLSRIREFVTAARQTDES